MIKDKDNYDFTDRNIGGGHAGMPDDKASLAQVLVGVCGFALGFSLAALGVILASIKGCVV